MLCSNVRYVCIILFLSRISYYRDIQLCEADEDYKNKLSTWKLQRLSGTRSGRVQQDDPTDRAWLEHRGRRRYFLRLGQCCVRHWNDVVVSIRGTWRVSYRHWDLCIASCFFVSALVLSRDATNATPTGHLYLQIVGACSIPGRAGFPRFISKGGTTQCSYLPNRSSALCNVSLKISCEKVDAICDFIAKFFFPDQTLLFFYWRMVRLNWQLKMGARVSLDHFMKDIEDWEALCR